MEEVIFVQPETSYKISDLKQELIHKLEHLILSSILSSKSQLTVELSLLEKMLEYLKLSPNKKRSNSLAKPKPGRQNSQNQKQIDHYSTAHGALGPCIVDQSINVGASQNQDRDSNDNNFVNISAAQFQINNEKIISSSDSYVSSPDSNVSSPDSNVSALDYNVSEPDSNVSSPDSNVSALDYTVSEPDSNVSSPDSNADSNIMSSMAYIMLPTSYVFDFAENNNFDTQIYNDNQYYRYYFQEIPHPNMAFMLDEQLQ